AGGTTDPLAGYELPLRILLAEIVFHADLLQRRDGNRLRGIHRKRDGHQDRDNSGEGTFHGSSFPVRVIPHRIMRPSASDVAEDLLTFLSDSVKEQDRSAARCRQDDPEERPPSLFALELHAPSVSLDRPARRRQAKPHSSLVSRPRVVHTVEAIEDPTLMRRRNARTAVPNLDGNLTGASLIHGQ